MTNSCLQVSEDLISSLSLLFLYYVLSFQDAFILFLILNSKTCLSDHLQKWYFLCLKNNSTPLRVRTSIGSSVGTSEKDGFSLCHHPLLLNLAAVMDLEQYWSREIFLILEGLDTVYEWKGKSHLVVTYALSWMILLPTWPHQLSVLLVIGLLSQALKVTDINVYSSIFSL